MVTVVIGNVVNTTMAHYMSKGFQENVTDVRIKFVLMTLWPLILTLGGFLLVKVVFPQYLGVC